MEPKVQIYKDSKQNTYAVGKYRGKTIKGVARLNPNDSNSPTFGEILARTRFYQKYLSHQLEDIRIALIDATAAYDEAKRRLDKISDKADKIYEEKMEVEYFIEDLLNSID